MTAIPPGEHDLILQRFAQNMSFIQVCTIRVQFVDAATLEPRETTWHLGADVMLAAEYAKASLKAFCQVMIASTGRDLDVETDNNIYGAPRGSFEWDGARAQLFVDVIADATEKNTWAGVMVHVNAVNKTAKNGRPYTHLTWSPIPTEIVKQRLHRFWLGEDIVIPRDQLEASFAFAESRALEASDDVAGERWMRVAQRVDRLMREVA